MGTWGIEPFSNDEALDLLVDLEEAVDVRAALHDVMFQAANAEGYLETGPEAVAAVAVVAVGAGSRAEDVSDDWALQRIATLDISDADIAALVPLTGPVLDRVVAGDCELFEQWVRAGEAEGFLEIIDGLRRALRPRR